MNEKLRLRARGAGVPLWKIAAYIGISETTLTRWLRVPLSAERERQIKAAIKEIAAHKEG